MKTLLMTLALCMLMTSLQAQEIRMPEKPQTKPYVHYSDNNRGVWVGAGAGCYLSQRNGVSLIGVGGEVVCGYRFNEFLKIGAGVAPIFFVNTTDSSVSVPLFLDVRGNFLPQEPRMFSPYWSFDLGYDLKMEAFVISPTLGLKFGALRNTFLLGLSYMLERPNDGDKDASHLLGVKIAYEF